MADGVEKTIFILLAAESPEDALLTRRAFRLCGIPTIVDVVSLDREAIDYLEGNGKYGNRDIFPFPELIVLDVDEGWESAFEILKWLKGSSCFQKLPAAILSSADGPGVISRAYALGAVAYIVKPAGFKEMERLLRDCHVPAIATVPGEP